MNIIKLERLGCYGEHKVPVLAICRSNGKPMRTLLVKRKVCLCKPRASLPWECERYLLFLFCLAKNPHWEGNSEEILGGARGSMGSQESSVGPAKGEQGALLAKIP